MAKPNKGKHQFPHAQDPELEDREELERKEADERLDIALEGERAALAAAEVQPVQPKKVPVSASSDVAGKHSHKKFDKFKRGK